MLISLLLSIDKGELAATEYVVLVADIVPSAAIVMLDPPDLTPPSVLSVATGIVASISYVVLLTFILFTELIF